MDQEVCAFCRLFGKPKKKINLIIFTGAISDSFLKRIIEILSASTKPDSVVAEIDYTSFVDVKPIVNSAFKPNDSCELPDRSIPEQTCIYCQDRQIKTVYPGPSKINPSKLMDFFCKQSTTEEHDSLGKWFLLFAPCVGETNFWKLFIDMKNSQDPTFDFFIVNLVATEYCLFENAIEDDRRLNEYYEDILPSYESFIEDFLCQMDASEEMQKNTIFIEYHNEFDDESLELLLKSLSNDQRSDYRQKNQEIRERIIEKFERKSRQAKDVSELRQVLNLSRERKFKPIVTNIVSQLKDNQDPQIALRETFELMQKMTTLSREDRRYLKRVLMLGFYRNDRHVDNTVLMQLIRVAIEFLKNQNEEIFPTIYAMSEVIWKLSSHIHFRFIVFDTMVDIYPLSLALITHRYPPLAICGLRICSRILAADQFEFKYALKYLKHDPLCARKVLDAVVYLLSPFLEYRKKLNDTVSDDSTNSTKKDSEKSKRADDLVEYCGLLVQHDTMKPLISLFRGSTEHCAHATEKDIKMMINVIEILLSALDFASDKSDSLILAGELCSTLLPVLQYGTRQVNRFFGTERSLTEMIPTIIFDLTEIDSKSSRLENCIELFNHLVRLQFSQSLERPESRSEDDSESISSDEENTSNDKCIDQPTQSQERLSSRDIIQQYSKLKQNFNEMMTNKAQASKKDELMALLEDEWKKLDVLQMKCDYEKTKQQHESANEKLKESHEKLECLKLELERYRRSEEEIKKKFDQHLSQLNAQNHDHKDEILTERAAIHSTEADQSFLLDMEKRESSQITSEDAKRFILEIYRRRTTFNDSDMRKSICGSLKHLGSDLYSSSVHFLHELIQNAEDNEYGNDVVPCFRITLDDKYILLSNNERGFRAKDVLAICSLAISTKAEKQCLGNKGIGFKSVFAASNQPTLISHSWKFRFEIPGVDRMSYITPLWIDNETVLDPIAEYLSMYPEETHLYLPLKFMPHSEVAIQFLDDVMRANDPCILLTLNNLKKLHINDKRSKKLIDIEKVVQSKIDLKNNDIVNFEFHTFEELSGSIIELHSSSVITTFRVYDCKVTIPSAGEQNRNSKTKLTLAFPCDKNYQLKATVYAGLPVCDLGFNFMFNADFQLVTNRENIRENVTFNCDLRNKLAAFFVYVLMNDPELRIDMNRFCPSPTSFHKIHSSWWKIMVDLINDLILKTLCRKDKILRYSNTDLELLVSKDDLSKFANIELIEINNQFFTKERLESIGIQPVSIMDVLNCFPSQENATNQEFYDRALEKDESWWSSMFNQLSTNMNTELAQKMLSKPLFILDKNQQRTFLPRNSNESGLVLYVNGDSSVKMWKKRLTILYYKSESERSALLESKQIQLLTEKELIEIILLDHLEKANSLESLELSNDERKELWLDLRYLRSRLNKFDCSNPLLIPVQDSCRPRLITETIMTSLLGVEIKSFVRDRLYPFIQLPPDDEGDEPLFQSLQWEYFLLKVNCQPPAIKLRKKYTLSSLPVLQIFNKCYSAEYSAMAEFIISKQTSTTRETLASFPVHVKINGEEKIYPISKAFDISIEPNLKYLPHIKIAQPIMRLAGELGICTQYDIKTCVSILCILAEQEHKEVNPYFNCLIRLQSEIMEKPNEVDFERLEKSCQLFLNSDEKFCQFSNLFILVEDHDDYLDTIKAICKYLNLQLISNTHNQVYWHFKELFGVLKCKFSFSFKDICTAIVRASTDTENFHPIGDNITIMRPDGRNLIIDLFKYLEHKISKEIKDLPSDSSLYRMVIGARNQRACIGSKEDLEWRFELFSDEVVSNHDFLMEIKQLLTKILTVENKMVQARGSKTIYACLEPSIIQNLSEFDGQRHFVCPVIVRDCPVILSLLGIDYIEAIGSLKWHHKNNNQEIFHQQLTTIFQETTGISEIQVVSARYADLSFRFIGKPRIDDHLNRKRLTIQSDYEFLILGNVVLLCISEASDTVIAKSATLALVTLLHHKKYLSLEEAKIDANKAMNNCRGFRSINRWDLSSSKDTTIALSEAIFPLNKEAIQLMSISIGTDCFIENDDNQKRKLIIATDRLEIDQKYRSLVQHQDHYSIIINPNLPVSNCYVADTMEHVIIGKNAEHFFFNYLLYHYGENNVDPREYWKSSNRLSVYPSYKSGIDDSIGYDFFLQDSKEIFVKGENGRTKKCYFEIKGTSGIFNPETTIFNITQNEFDTCEKIATNSQRSALEAYFVVIIQNCLDSDNIGFGRMINWSNDMKQINGTPDVYQCRVSATYDKNQDDRPASTREHTQNTQDRRNSNAGNNDYTNRSENRREYRGNYPNDNRQRTQYNQYYSNSRRDSNDGSAQYRQSDQYYSNYPRNYQDRRQQQPQHYQNNPNSRENYYSPYREQPPVDRTNSNWRDRGQGQNS